MDKLSSQQQSIVDAPLEAMCVVACAGSGKTKTAVERLAKVREALGSSRSHVALLSFSNIAVSTFQNLYLENKGTCTNLRVTIDTFDSFITNNIIRPHAYRTMGCSRVPFLLDGSEPFLLNDKFKFWYEEFPGSKRSVEGYQINDIVTNIDDVGVSFSYRFNDKKYLTNNGIDVVKRLGLLGAYTHELGKFWSLLTLADQPEILRVLANRYPHIIVDEAQDIGELHQNILELLIQQGVKVTLIGDPNQAIYEFAGATGDFITSFNSKPENRSFHLSTNYRSIPEILNVANLLSRRSDIAFNQSTSPEHGAFYAIYNPSNPRKLVETFQNKLNKSNISASNSAVLCRGNSGIDKIRAPSKNVGQGKTKLLVLAAIHRDENSDFHKAFKLVVSCVVGLLDNAPDNLAFMLLNSSRYPEVRGMYRDLWLFVRSINEGLPSAHLKGSSTWHSLVKERLINLLDSIERKYGFSKVKNIGNKLSKKGLADEALISDTELAIDKIHSVRLDTVHKAKGESLDAVLYVASKAHIIELLGGVGTEVGRIGYVALTRARNLFILGVPKNAANELVPKLQEIGLREL